MSARGVARPLLNASRGEEHMWFVVFLLLALWFLGFMTSATLGGLLHILLVVAIILFLVDIIEGNAILTA